MLFKRSVCLLFVAFSLFGCKEGRSQNVAPKAVVPQGANVYDCAREPDCRAVEIAGDAPSPKRGGGIPFFRGYADPSVESDPTDGSVWMSYSWMKNLSEGGKPKILGFVETHLAKSTDGGHSFQFVKAINSNTPFSGPKKGTPGWLNHEVSSIVRVPGGRWQLLWLSYHKSNKGKPYEGGPFYNQSTAQGAPRDLGAAIEPTLGGEMTSPTFGARHNLSQIPGLGGCKGFTEPALLTYRDEVYLGMNCMVFGLGGRKVKQEKFFLLRQTAGGYEFVADVLTHDDARALGAERLEQVDLFETRAGTVGMLATPIRKDGRRSIHMGCHFIEFANFEAGRIKRDAAGAPDVGAIITDSQSQPLGPGACTYDPRMEAGVLMIRRQLPPYAKGGVEFTLMKTGVHP